MTPKRLFTDSEEEEIVKIYLAGYSTKQISAAYRRGTHGVISCALKRQGVKGRQFRYVHKRDSTIFSKIDTEEKAYWLGFLYADGCVTKSQIQLILSTKDAEHVKKFAAFIGDAPLRQNTYGGWHRTGATVYDRKMADDLRSLGIIPYRPDHTTAINNVPDDLLHHFLRGNFDGNGCAAKCQTLGFCGKEAFMTFIRDEMARKVGTNPELKLLHHQCGKVCYINFRRRGQAFKVSDYLYKDATVFLERKKDVIESWR